MNKLFIGLLIVAAGAGIFFLLNKKNHASDLNSIKKEWIIGKWKDDAGKDSVFRGYRYDFLENGNIVRSLNDSAKADTSHYEWNRNDELVWKEKPADSTASVFAVVKLTKDSLELQSKDGAIFLFTKSK